MLNKIKGLFVEEEGQGMAEYGLIIGLVAVVLIGSIVIFRKNLEDMFSGISLSDPGDASN
ncbi:Flp family type IVb pilin [Pullulanibacillus sp. KACC 23026]|uniref:Flp family type IVb pilin n=1 Tax=Pullulanibacillus sp. KACC 23026 TaxID=3028315 RepID=UPI0023B1F56E|nr:Flp family type IVb pilin [Pullulanibacillus sp. KACC 23026]WEG13577.1 Flp family type IVb pilin [Pullulanibacillus sp. KACC 23026]